MNVYRYEAPVDTLPTLREPTIFLGGCTVRGNQPHLTSWRFEAIAEFERQGFTGNLIVPEFVAKEESDKGKEWIPIWEFTGLRRADCIMFWIPRTRELIGLTTNCELGYWMGRERQKIVYGRPNDSYRHGYNDIMWVADLEDRCNHHSDDHIYTTLEETVSASIKKARELTTMRFPKTVDTDSVLQPVEEFYIGDRVASLYNNTGRMRGIEYSMYWNDCNNSAIQHAMTSNEVFDTISDLLDKEYGELYPEIHAPKIGFVQGLAFKAYYLIPSGRFCTLYLDTACRLVAPYVLYWDNDTSNPVQSGMTERQAFTLLAKLINEAMKKTNDNF